MSAYYLLLLELLEKEHYNSNVSSSTNIKRKPGSYKIDIENTTGWHTCQFIT